MLLATWLKEHNTCAPGSPLSAMKDLQLGSGKSLAMSFFVLRPSCGLRENESYCPGLHV